MPTSESNRKSQQMQYFLGRGAEKLGRATGFVQRTSKMSGAVFAQTMIMGCLGEPEATLAELVQYSADAGVEISEAGLQQRLTDRAVAFMDGLLKEAIVCFSEGKRLPEAVLRRFTSVNILDSSQITLPDVLGEYFTGTQHTAALKLQLSFEYLHGVFRGVTFTSARQPDQKCDLPVQIAEPGSLHVFDLGYFKQQVFQKLAAVGAFFVSRLQTQTALYSTADGATSMDLLTFLHSLTLPRWEGWLYLGHSVRLPVRLLAEKLPESVACERRRRARQVAKRRGTTCSQRHLVLQEWSLFITNVPADWLSFDQILLLYRVRWQIELLFKLCKSQAKLACIGQWCPQRLLCQLYARLLGVVLFQWVISPWRVLACRELSLPKAFRIMQRRADDWLKAIAQTDWQTLANLFDDLIADFLRFACKSQRKKSPSTYQRLVLSGA